MGMRQEYWLQVLATPRPGSLVAHLDVDEAGTGALNTRSIYKHIVRSHASAQCFSYDGFCLCNLAYSMSLLSKIFINCTSQGHLNIKSRTTALL